jgi:hypothetical protein
VAPLGQTVDVELDTKGLGRLLRVADPRDVWKSESGEFTPWLAENLDVLADELGMTLTLVATEVPVGDFRLDIQAEDGQGNVVAIENQLERTDHSHLGQCLIYASGLEAGTVVWVAPQFRDEYRCCIDWLNERTDEKVKFFGVEISLVRIGEGPMAPVFEVIARPNSFTKTTKGRTAIGGGTDGLVTPLNARRQQFFADVLAEVNAMRPALRVPTPQRGNWLSFASGPFGYWCVSQITGGQARVEAYIDTANRTLNKRLFDSFHAEADHWQEIVGATLSWERLDDKRASRIARYQNLDLDDDASVVAAKEWAVGSIIALYDAMNEPLRVRARELRKKAEAVDASEAGVGVTVDDELVTAAPVAAPVGPDLV